MLKSLSIVGLALTLGACTSTKNQSSAVATNGSPAIINGTPVTLENPIASVAVKVETDAGGCSGTMIASRFVLTAAHCLDGATTAKITLADGRIASNPAKFYIHPDFHPDQSENRNDVGVIEFDNDFKLTTFAKLADDKTNPVDGTAAFIAGYGLSKTDGEYDDFGTLRSLDVTITNLKYSDDEVEIAEGATSGACHGDSGGPGYSLVNGDIVVWGLDVINSRNSNTDCFQFELYTRVSSYTPWLQTVLDGKATPAPAPTPEEEPSPAPSADPSTAASAAPAAQAGK